jgi:hypothetical protein
MLSALRRTLQTVLGLAFFTAGVALGGELQMALWLLAATAVLTAAD